ncbi:MAG: hypothetical protein ACXABH_11085, partial [Candidatus Thorarchaeota archaeon]
MNETPDEQSSTEDASDAVSGVGLVDRLRNNLNVVVLFFAAIIITTVSCLYYFDAMIALGDPGFTLDDSWIHLQFARTIFEGTP